MILQNNIYVLNWMRSLCRYPRNYVQSRNVHFAKPDGHPRELEYTKTCPDKMFASGIHGRAGLYIDRIGLICRRLDWQA